MALLLVGSRAKQNYKTFCSKSRGKGVSESTKLLVRDMAQWVGTLFCKHKHQGSNPQQGRKKPSVAAYA